jgi:hypothetical protein
MNTTNNLTPNQLYDQATVVGQRAMQVKEETRAQSIKMHDATYKDKTTPSPTSTVNVLCPSCCQYKPNPTFTCDICNNWFEVNGFDDYLPFVEQECHDCKLKRQELYISEEGPFDNLMGPEVQVAAMFDRGFHRGLSKERAEEIQQKFGNWYHGFKRIARRTMKFDTVSSIIVGCDGLLFHVVKIAKVNKGIGSVLFHVGPVIGLYPETVNHD